MEIKVIKASFHCGKPFFRSKTWQPSTWKDKIKVSFGQEIADNIGEDSSFVETLDAGVKERYVTDL